MVLNISCHPFRIWIQAGVRSRIISSRWDFISQSSPSVCSGTRPRASIHNQAHGRSWSVRRELSLRTSSTGWQVGSPKYKAQLKALCGGSGYSSRRRSGDLPNSRSYLGQAQKTTGRTSPTRSPIQKKETVRDRTKQIFKFDQIFHVELLWTLSC